MEWRAVVGYEGFYEVSSTGRVRSLPRVVKHWTGVDVHRRGRMLKPALNNRYLKVNLCLDGAMRQRPIHLIMLEAFVGPRPPGRCSRHRDGDALNNRIGNLVYGSFQDNSDDRVKHGRAPRGEDHALAKLTDAKVRRIRKMLTTHTGSHVAREFNMSTQQISNIKLGKSWAHVEG